VLARRPLALALLVVSAACGKSREEEEFDRLAAQCRALVAGGATLRVAGQMFEPNLIGGPVCIAQLASMGGNDTCPASSSENPQCQVFYYWYPVDPGLCEVSGCWLVCEMRVMRQDPGWGDNPSALDAKICASRFLRGQPTP
jgi:hypothetical protein